MLEDMKRKEGLSWEGVATRCNVVAKTIWSYRHGVTSTLQPDNVRSVAKALGLEPGQVYDAIDVDAASRRDDAKMKAASKSRGSKK